MSESYDPDDRSYGWRDRWAEERRREAARAGIAEARAALAEAAERREARERGGRG